VPVEGSLAHVKKVPVPRRLTAPSHDPSRDMTKFVKSQANGYEGLKAPEHAERRQLHIGEMGCAWKWNPRQDVHGLDVGSVKGVHDRQACESACIDQSDCNAFIVTSQLTCDLKHIPKLWWNFYAKDTVAYSADLHQHEEETGRDLYMMDKECKEIRAPKFETGPMDPYNPKPSEL
jgi:hypothetical protein